MPKYKDNHSDESDVDELAQTIDNEFGVPIMTPIVKKAFTMENKELCCSSWEKNLVIRFGYNDHMAYHYAFMMNVATIQEP